MFPRDLSTPIAAAYEPAKVEQGWSDWWEQEGFFKPCEEAEENFVMIMPPPNVTGSLHLGHSITNAIEDTLTRWHRMLGHRTVWVPGTDHAGIATQAVVERALAKSEGISRHELGREDFIKKVWEWKDKYGGVISNQLRRLGISADWSREAFTLSPSLCRAVKEAFIILFDRKLIYRATKLVSWCPHLQTAISDIEVDVEEIDKPTRIRIPGYQKTVEVGILWYFKYPVKGQKGRFLEVATTRIETMLGDVAVAVNPKDKRYLDLVGCQLEHPFLPERNVVVVADDHVDIEFGTGAVKITPAHDKNDFEIGQRHGLKSISVFTLDGKISAAGGKEFAGMHRFDARVAVEKRLEELGLLVDKKPNDKKMQLPKCSRSGDIIEYMLIPQWWMNCREAADKALAAVNNGELQIIPETYNQTWSYWLENIRDWCISRQLWWGHRIPAYKAVFAKATEDDEVWVAARDEKEAIDKIRARCPDRDVVGVEQDEDVLDTWFSSGLFPFSVFGWPDQTNDLKKFFPTTLLETGHDIIFFWVARMVMFSYLLMGRLPFKTVYLHAMVRDAHGKKMSKSLGNVIDPVEVIEGITLEEMHAKLLLGNLPEKEVIRAKDAQKKDFPKGIPECGADALRYGLLAYSSQGRSVNLDINRVVNYRFFCNKLWNATKFALIYFPTGFKATGELTDLQWEDKWILHRLNEAVVKTNEAFHKYSFSDAVQATHGFFLYDFCDVYLELLKPRFISNPGDKGALETLHMCLEKALALLHPMIPFVTEELYQRLPPSPTKKKSICIARYPEPRLDWFCPEVNVEAEALMSAVRHLRSLSAQLGVDPKLRLDGFVLLKDGSNFPSGGNSRVQTLAKLKSCTVTTGSVPESTVSDVVNAYITVALDPAGTVDLAAVVAKLKKKQAAIEKSLTGYQTKMKATNYDKVPEEVKQTNIEKVKQLAEELEAIQRAIASVEGAM